MAKSKATITVEAKEKGVKMVQKDVEDLASSTNKAGKESQNLAKNVATVDKNIKGTAAASSNATKNFSKMQQGMGGLVGVYASFAAQIFAITAAFNFLKSAGDLQTLKASQQSYAASTGLAMRVLADDIISATGAQISYQEASQAAAIGISAGLNPQQLKQLGTAAKDLSVTLGRDVTDSFNRLVRGVTKAEPELLDELGIILRLEDAQREYAISIGKTASGLTQFEKSQAVINKVLQEADKVAANAPDVINVYNQLGKVFDDIIIKLKTVADAIAGPIAKVFINTPALAIASFGLLLKGPLSALGISFGGIRKKADEAADAMSLAAQKAKAKYESTKITIQSTTDAIRAQSAAAVAAGSKSKLLQSWATGGAITPQGVATIKKSLDAALRNVNQHGIIVKGIWKGMSVEVVMAYKLALEQMELAEQDKVSGTAVNVAKINSLWASAKSGVASFGAFVLKWGSRLISWASWISLAYTAFQALKEIFGWFESEGNEAAEEAARLLEIQRERVADLNKEYKDFLITQSKLIMVGRGREALSNLGTMLGMQSSADFTQTVKDAREYQKEVDKIGRMEAKYAAQGGEPSAYTRRFGGRRGTAVTMEGIQEAREALSNNEDLKNAADYIARITTTINAAFGKDAVNKFKPFINLLEVINNPLSTDNQIAQAQVAAQEFGAILGQTPTLLKNSEDALGSFLQGFAPMSEGQRAIEEMQKELQNLITTIGQAETVDPADIARIEEIGRLTQKISEWEERVTDAKIAQINLDKRREAALAGVDSLLAPSISKYYEMRGTQQSIRDLEAEKQGLQSIEKIDEIQREANQRRIREIDAELDLLRQRTNIQQEELNVLEAVKKIRLEILQVSNEIAEKELEKREYEFSQKSLELDKERLRVREELANIQADRAERDFDRRTLFSGVGKEQRLAEQAYQQELALVDVKIAQIQEEFRIKKEIAELENDILVSRLKISAQELKNKAADPANSASRESLIRQADATESLAGLQEQQGQRQIQLLDDQEALSIVKIFDSLDKLKYAKDNLTDIAELTKTFEDSFQSGMVEAFDSIIQGTMSVKDAFANMALNILKSLSKVITEMLVLKLIQTSLSLFSGGTYGTSTTLVGPPPPPKFKNGGIMSNGKKMMGYASGGVATGSTSGYPAILHGTEAVVPLPNGRSIPVEMSGSSQQNNVTVNVSIDNQGNASTQSSQSADQQAGTLGRLVANAVKKELLNQKRPGGILSPYGAA